jgi:hypothetical protein
MRIVVKKVEAVDSALFLLTFGSFYGNDYEVTMMECV